jgi:hypothetical protein
MQPIDSFATDGTTFVNPLGLIFTLVMCILLVVLPRKYALLPIIILVCYMTMGMRIVVGGFNFTMLRIVLPFGWLRLMLRGEMKRLNFNVIDKIFLAWVFVSIVAATLLWQSLEAFRGELGFAYNVLGFYFMFRFLIDDVDDVVRALRMFAVVIVPLAGAMILEKITGRNSFAIFGGVPVLTMVRDGTLRCQGPFAHPILAGTFAATLFAMFIGLYLRGEKRLYAVTAIIASSIIIITSASSGPILTAVLGVGALALWPWRASMRLLRWGMLLGVIGLQIVMKAPVWFLLARVDIVQGSTGYHRAYLIDRAIANFSDWWLVGTKSTWGWADKDAHLFDVTNAYIANGANGGFLGMVLFIAIIALCFKAVGRTVRLGEKTDSKANLIIFWALGASLFSHAATFLSVTYFDQNFVNWYLLLAMISSVAGSSLLMSRPAFFAKLYEEPAVEAAAGSQAGVAPAGRADDRLFISRLQAQPKLALGDVSKQRS